MKHRLTAAALAATALFAFTACSDDEEGVLPAAGDATTTVAGGDPAVTVPGGGGGITTLPNMPGVAPECMAIINAIAASATAASGQGDLAEAQAAMQGLVNGVPDELKADAQIFANAYAEFLTILSQYNGDFTQAMSAPEAMAALESMNSPEVAAASERISAYMNANCQS